MKAVSTTTHGIENTIDMDRELINLGNMIGELRVINDANNAIGVGEEIAALEAVYTKLNNRFGYEDWA